MKAPNLIALTASVLLTTASLAAINHNVSPVPPSEINGVKITNLAPVDVRPSAEDMRAAALLANASVATATVSPVVSRAAEASASLLGAQLAMPYYSFGNSFGRVSKE
ncbi:MULTISPECIES: hypothetical protein [Dyella]|uniref:Alpha/beta hydrolase n=2 Tax=Dyella TaxID=231454 RepID=A0A4R0YV11_9GAMM|nr:MULTISPECIES: hypothetical protein [Dyella]TBR39252.1 hypothetical protein EYV96_03190 [Dyella terrae]TCI13162.1 hypothetical protein EZM97_07675 [Dyella soli]